MTDPIGPSQAVPFKVPYRKVGVRLKGPSVELSKGFLRRLSSTCERVDTDHESCLEAGRDWWPIGLRWAHAGLSPARAGAVARPGDLDEVSGVLSLCNAEGVPVTAVAGRSGVCGASVPVFGGVALDLLGFAGITNVDDQSLLVDVRPGTMGHVFEASLRKDHNLTLGHWPQSIELSTVGGWLACRSAGQYSTRYGKIEDMTVGLEVALADGSIVRTGGSAPRAAMGPDLTNLFLGSEGTLGVITGARLRAHPIPSGESRRAYGFDRFQEGLDACRRILRRGATPAVLRLYDPTESRRHFKTDEDSVLIVLDESDPALVDAVMAVVDDECRSSQALDPGLVDIWLAHRNDVSALGELTKRGIVVDTAEISADWAALGGLYEAVTSELKSLELTLVASSHQSHSYLDGACLYFTFAGQPNDPEDLAEAEAYYRSAWAAVMSATLAMGGAISHHHGIGLNRGRWMRQALGKGFELLESLKASFDPKGILNPGKLGLPSRFGEAHWL